MRAKVRSFHSPDVYNLDTYVPDDPRDVGILIQVMVGPLDGPGDESFDVTVCTPRWLEQRLRGRGPMLGRHYVIVDEFDGRSVQKFLTKMMESSEADTWSALALRIGRIGLWEFEDYRP